MPRLAQTEKAWAEYTGAGGNRGWLWCAGCRMRVRGAPCERKFWNRCLLATTTHAWDGVEYRRVGK